jgi:hypothetical protein
MSRQFGQAMEADAAALEAQGEEVRMRYTKIFGM